MFTMTDELTRYIGYWLTQMPNESNGFCEAVILGPKGMII